MMMTRKVLLFILALLVISSVLALDYDYEIVDGSAHPGEHFEYRVTIINDAGKEVSASAYSPHGDFSPTYPYSISSGESKTVTLKIYVELTDYPGEKFYPIYLSDGVEEINFSIPGRVVFREIEVRDMAYPSSINPSSEVQVSLKVINSYTPRDTFLRLQAIDNKGDVYAEKEIQASLKVGSNTIRIPLLFETISPPGAHYLIVSTDFGPVAQRDFIINVQEFGDYEVTEDITENILGAKGDITLKNTGNKVLSGHELSTPMSFFRRIFTLSKTSGSKYSAGRLVLEVNDLEPGKETHLKYYVSYLPLYLSPFILAGLFFLFKYYTQKIRVVKEVFDQKVEEGKLSMKTLVRIKNMSNRVLRDVEILDPLPTFADKIGRFGTIKGKMEERGYSRYIKWILDEIKPREDIVLSYFVTTKVGLIGSYNLNPSVVEFMLDKKLYIVKSNRVIVNIV
jgi:hypothetical protein